VTASHDAPQNGKSILSDVARHENELLSRIDASNDEARKIVERARADAARHISEESARAESDAANIRSEATRSREAKFAAAVADAKARLEARRGAAMSRVEQMARDVLGMFLPKGGAR
jgi:vacuolar-type H+-ATPase subunit H